jgi:hypothetical protein
MVLGLIVQAWLRIGSRGVMVASKRPPWDCLRKYQMNRIRILCWVLAAVVTTSAVGGDGMVALQTAESSCPYDRGNLYVDCGNGTVTDSRTSQVRLAPIPPALLPIYSPVSKTPSSS